PAILPTFRARRPALLPSPDPDPPLPGPRRPPGAAARAGRVRRTVPSRPGLARRAHLGPRARGGGDRVPRGRHLPRLAARGAALRARLGGAVVGGDHRRDAL